MSSLRCRPWIYGNLVSRTTESEEIAPARTGGSLQRVAVTDGEADQRVRLSSKSHWDVPVELPGPCAEPLHDAEQHRFLPYDRYVQD